jgi:REP element-mobilizing transposase RayT
MNSVALAYLITIRCYGTWLHGDPRGSMDRKEHNRYGGPKIEPKKKKKMSEAEEAEFKQPAFALTASQRAVVERAIGAVCDHRGYQLLAVNARTNHVHSVVAAGCRPEVVMNALKAYATRRLRGAGLVANGVRPWSRDGSNPYLWTSEQVARAIDYILHGQDDKPFDRDAPHGPTGQKALD